MSVTDTQLWWLLRRDLEAARSVLEELYGRGFDIGDVLNPLREAQAAIPFDSPEEREPDHGDEPHEFYADLADSQEERTP